MDYKRNRKTSKTSFVSSASLENGLSSKMKYIVDVQGFKTTLNEFVVKGLAVVSLEYDPTPSVFLFKLPYAWDKLLYKNKCENRWLEENFHGIMWRAGSILYEEISSTLSSVLFFAEKIYVKGLEKSKWLKKFFPINKLLFF